MEFLRRLGRLYRAQFRTVGRLRPTLGGLLLRTVAWIVVAWLSLFVAVWLTPGVEIKEGGSVLVAVTIMALLEVALRPLLMALALPIGLIAVALIGLLFRIALFLIVLPRVGIAVDGFLVAIIASGIYAAVLTFLGGLIGMSDEDSFSARVVAQVVRDEERAPDHRRARRGLRPDRRAGPARCWRPSSAPATCRRWRAGCATARTD